MTGPRLRTDLVLAVVYRASPLRWLQMRRARGPMAGTGPGSWHPVMGHVEEGETAADAVRRELGEELGLAGGALAGLWQLDGVHPFFLATPDEVYLSSAFVARAADGFKPSLNDEHDAWRWVDDADAGHRFVWPFQLAAVEEARRYVLRPTPAREMLRIDPHG
ncbi:MAG: NUDIX domain-containing protein [Planctomycetota bacterium]